MIMHRYSKLGLIACIAVLAAAVQVRADIAEACALLTDTYAALAEASTAMAANPESSAARDRVGVIQGAVSDANEAFNALNAGGGDNPAAMDALRRARQQALGDAAPQAASDQPYVPPNIHDVPWETEGRRGLQNQQYQIKQDTTTGGGDGYAERDFDITPI